MRQEVAGLHEGRQSPAGQGSATRGTGTAAPASPWPREGHTPAQAHLTASHKALTFEPLGARHKVGSANPTSIVQ